MREEILKKFCSNNEMRPAMQNPFVKEDFVCATNGHIGIITPKINCDKDYSKNPSFEIIKILETLNYLSKPIKIDLSEHFDKIPKVPIFEQKKEIVACDECDGEGVVECYACNHEHDCDECYGLGTIEKYIDTDKIIGHKIDDENSLINIYDVYFNPKYVQIIRDISENWEIISLSNKQSSVWQFNDIKILLMPIRFTNNPERKVYDITPTDPMPVYK